MIRIKRGVNVHQKHKKIIKLAKGYQGRNSNVYRIALPRIEKALQYQYQDRKRKKREFKTSWILRINSFCNSVGLNYGTFISNLKQSQILLNKKILSQLSITEPYSFYSLTILKN